MVNIIFRHPLSIILLVFLAGCATQKLNTPLDYLSTEKQQVSEQSKVEIKTEKDSGKSQEVKKLFYLEMPF